MLEAQAEKTIAASAERVWALAGNFGGLKDWLPGVVHCQVEGSGAQEDGGNAIRRVEQMDGSVVKEALLALDDSRFTYRYAILEAKGFGADTQFEATFTVQPLEDGHCHVVWSARFTLPAGTPDGKVVKARERVQQMYGFFLQHLATLLERR